MWCEARGSNHNEHFQKVLHACLRRPSATPPARPPARRTKKPCKLSRCVKFGAVDAEQGVSDLNPSIRKQRYRSERPNDKKRIRNTYLAQSEKKLLTTHWKNRFAKDLLRRTTGTVPTYPNLVAAERYVDLFWKRYVGA